MNGGEVMVMRCVLRVRFGTWIIVPQKLLREMAKSSWKVHWVFHWVNRFLWQLSWQADGELLALESDAYMRACSVASVTSNSLQHHVLWPARFLCPWDFPGKNTGVGCHFLLQGSSRPRDQRSLVSPMLAGGFFRVWDIWVLIFALQITCYVALGISCSFSEPLFSNL